MIELKSDTVTLLGMHTDTLYKFKPDGSEVWAIGHHRAGVEWSDRVFEAHEYAVLMRRQCENSYLNRWLMELQDTAKTKPVYTRWRFPFSLGPNHVNAFVPSCRLNNKGQEFIESSIGYMLACALFAHKNITPIKRLQMYGISMKSTGEYVWQKPNVLYLIGRLEEAGVEIFVPEGCELWSSAFETGSYGLYDNLGPPKEGRKYKPSLEECAKLKVEFTDLKS